MLKHLMIALALISISATNQARPIIYDTDMAIDDWLALLYLAEHPDVDLKAVTVSTSGESHCEPAKVNIPNLLALTSIEESPITACGDDYPLDGYFVFPEPWQVDSDTLSGIKLKTAEKGRFPVTKEHAAKVIHDVMTDSDEKVDIIAVGPLTNVAQWLERYPEDKQKLGKLYIMGGNWKVPGNIIVPLFTKGHPNTTAEWNIFIDSLAAHQVMISRIEIVVVGLDVTNQVRVTHPYADNFKKVAETRSAEFIDNILDKNRWFIDSHEYYYWDVLTVLIAMNPDLCESEKQAFHVDHSLAGETPYLGTSDLSIPDTRYDGKNRRHLSAKTAGTFIPVEEGPMAHYCVKTNAEQAFSRFTAVINQKPEK